MPQLNLSQSLLLKSCFLDEGDDYFGQWFSTFGEVDLDYYTRAIIPALLATIPIDNYSPKLHRKMQLYKRQTWLFNTLKWQQLKPVLDDFSKADISCCLLKGAAMVLFYYQDVSHRPEYSDIDLFIKKGDLKKAIPILKKHHFIPQTTFLWNSAELEQAITEEQRILEAHHAIHYKKDKLIIDLHWNLSPLISNTDFKSLEGEMLCKPKMGNTLYFFNLEMQIIHIATHTALQNSSYPSLNSIIDFCFLINNTKPDFKPLNSLCTRLGLTVFVVEALQKYKDFIADDIYSQYELFFKPLSPLKERYLAPLLYSKSQVKRRGAQLYYMFKKNKYNPMLTIRNMWLYVGAKHVRQLYYLLMRRSRR